MYISQVINGLVLPVILVVMLLLINNRKLMGDYTNRRVYNCVSWITSVILAILSLFYLFTLVKV
jgi:Mn2+/Fe2+ NRAMP family transporter